MGRMRCENLVKLNLSLKYIVPERRFLQISYIMSDPRGLGASGNPNFAVSARRGRIRVARSDAIRSGSCDQPDRIAGIRGDARRIEHHAETPRNLLSMQVQIRRLLPTDLRPLAAHDLAELTQRG